MEENIKYATMDIDNKEFLDKDDCPTKLIEKAFLWDTYNKAEYYRKDIDVAYLYKTVKVKICYEVVEEKIW